MAATTITSSNQGAVTVDTYGPCAIVRYGTLTLALNPRVVSLRVEGVRFVISDGIGGVLREHELTFDTAAHAMACGRAVLTALAVAIRAGDPASGAIP